MWSKVKSAPVMPSTCMKAWRYICPCKHHKCHKKLNDNRNEEEARKVDEADHINGKLGYDEQYPGHQLKECARGQKSSESLLGASVIAPESCE